MGVREQKNSDTGRALVGSKPLNRREFTSSIALGAAAPLLAGGATGAAAEPEKTETSKLPSQVERLLELVLQQHPDKRLDEAAIAEIREELEAQVARSAQLSAFPLSNADEPGFVFRAFRKEE
jgi:hypothetical protein